MRVDEMPFRASFRDAIIKGRKTAASRGNKYGGAGDVLTTPFGKIRLTEVFRQRLEQVKTKLWLEEGCDSADHFEAVWRGLHRGKFDPEALVYVHRFKFLGEWRGHYCTACDRPCDSQCGTVAAPCCIDCREREARGWPA